MTWSRLVAPVDEARLLLLGRLPHIPGYPTTLFYHTSLRLIHIPVLNCQLYPVSCILRDNLLKFPCS